MCLHILRPNSPRYDCHQAERPVVTQTAPYHYHTASNSPERHPSAPKVFLFIESHQNFPPARQYYRGRAGGGHLGYVLGLHL